MRLVTYISGLNAARLGVLADGLVVDVERFGSAHGLALPDDMLSFIDNGVTLLPVLKELLGDAAERLPAGSALPLENVTLQAPIPRPRKNIFGIGLNSREHVAESAKSLDTDKDLPKQPVLFSKPPTTVVGPGGAVRPNAKMTHQLDWEGEQARRLATNAASITS